MSTTKKAMAQSLMKLLSTRTLDRIKVSDITDDCGVNRQTFYYHFKDIYDLLERVFKVEIGQEFDARMPGGSWKEATEFLFTGMLKKRDLFLNTYHSLPSAHIRRYLSGLIRPKVTEYIRDYVGRRRVNEADLTFLADFYTMLIISVTLNWFDRGMPENSEAEMDKFYFLLDGSIEWGIEHFLDR